MTVGIIYSDLRYDSLADPIRERLPHSRSGNPSRFDMKWGIGLHHIVRRRTWNRIFVGPVVNHRIYRQNCHEAAEKERSIPRLLHAKDCRELSSL